MKLVLAGALPLAALPIVTNALKKTNAFQALFGPGGQYSSVGAYIGQLLNLGDGGEQARLNATINEVRQNLNRTFTGITGADLFNPFTPEKAAWLQTAINAEIAGAVQKLNTARAAGNAGEQRVFARYIKAFEILTAENKQRLLDAKAQIPGANDNNFQKVAVAASVGGLLLKLTGAI